jgi:hypothetical protein
MQPITYLIASTLLSPIVLAAPRPQAAPQNPTWQDFDVSTQVSGPNGSFTIESRLTDFRGCSGDRTKVVKKAFADALKIVGSVGKPGLILGHEPGDETPKDQVV